MTDQFPPPDYILAESTVSGITIYQPAPEEETHQEVVDFSCPQCGANTAYSITDGGLTCTHCGYYQAPEMEVAGKGAASFEFTVETMQRAAQGWGVDRQELACGNCGAVTTLPTGDLTHTCPFCASNKVIQRQAHQDVLRPRFLVPFDIKPETTIQLAQEWMGSSWMTPSKLQDLARLTRFTPIYLPYWTFDAAAQSDWRAQVGHTVTERYYDSSSRSWKTRTKIEWRWEAGQVRKTFDDLLIPGTKKLSTHLLGQIKPYNMEKLTPYAPDFLAGQQAQAYDFKLEDAWEEARREMRESTREACREQASTPMIRSFTMSLDFSDESWRYIMLPVYVAAYRFSDETYQVMLNGQTGVIAGQRPVDWLKVALASAAALAPGVLLGILGLITLIFGGLGVVIGGVGFVLLIIGLGITIYLVQSALKLDDV